MDQLSAFWTALPDLARGALSSLRSLPDPALFALGVTFLIAVLSRSLAAVALAAGILWMPAVVLSAHPADDRSWLILGAAGAASLLATAVAYHRRRLAKRARALAATLIDVRKELGDLRTSYEHALVSRGAEEREREDRATKPFMVIPRADLVRV